MIIWFLQSFDLHLNLVKDSADSILAMVAGVLAPIFKPIGLGDWRICTALISGFMAKRERGIYSGSTFQWKYCLCTDSAGSSIPAGVQFTLYTMCGGYRFDQT